VTEDANLVSLFLKFMKYRNLMVEDVRHSTENEICQRQLKKRCCALPETL